MGFLLRDGLLAHEEHPIPIPPRAPSASLSAAEMDEGARKTTEWPPPPTSPPSLVVRSPRQTVSLIRNRRPHRDWDNSSRAPSFAAARDHGPKPSEVYGFVGSITTVIATAVYVAWAYTPEPALRSLGITYYPSKYEMLLQFCLTLLPSLRCASSSCGRFFFLSSFWFLLIQIPESSPPEQTPNVRNLDEIERNLNF
jgi:hypothetical protein